MSRGPYIETHTNRRWHFIDPAVEASAMNSAAEDAANERADRAEASLEQMRRERDEAREAISSFLGCDCDVCMDNSGIVDCGAYQRMEGVAAEHRAITPADVAHVTTTAIRAVADAKDAAIARLTRDLATARMERDVAQAKVCTCTFGPNGEQCASCARVSNIIRDHVATARREALTEVVTMLTNEEGDVREADLDGVSNRWRNAVADGIKGSRVRVERMLAADGEGRS